MAASSCSCFCASCCRCPSLTGATSVVTGNTFRYEHPLQTGQIRLLEFETHPLIGGAQQLRILNASLPSDRAQPVPGFPIIPYWTLSYVWGCQDAQELTDILINGQSFAVGPNLAAILQDLERRRIGAPIWVDAICINQRDADEKNGQVAQMTDVYRYSKRTIIHLGGGDGRIGHMLRHLESLGRKAIEVGLSDLNETDIRVWPTTKETTVNIELQARLEALIAEIAGTFSGADLKALAEVSHKPWFGRAWIIQELCLAHEYEVSCSGYAVRGDLFLAGFQLCNFWIIGELRRLAEMSSLYRLPQVIFNSWQRNGFSVVWTLCKILIGRGQRPSVRAATTLGTRRKWKSCEEKPEGATSSTLKHHLLRAFTPNSDGVINASVCKDRIYALLGICSDKDLLSIVPRYEKDVTHQHVYTDAAKRMLQQGHLDILSLCQPHWGEAQRDANLPSWAPDWSKELRASWGLAIGDGLFCASGEKTFRCAAIHSTSLPSSLIQIEAYFVGTVTVCHQPGTIWKSEEAASDVQRMFMTLALIRIWLSESSLGYSPQQCSQKTAQFKEDSIFDPQECPMGIWLNATGSRCNPQQRSTGVWINESVPEYSQQQREEGVWRVPIADREYNSLGQVVRATSRSREEFDRLARMFKSRLARLMLPSSVSYIGNMLDLREAMVFKSNNGYVGLCSDGTHQHDEIWIPRGAHVPYLFRRTQKHRYKLVGECFVYGIMDGEFIANDPWCQVITLE